MIGLERFLTLGPGYHFWGHNLLQHSITGGTAKLPLPVDNNDSAEIEYVLLGLSTVAARFAPSETHFINYA